MIELTEYCRQKNISRRWANKLIATGKLEIIIKDKIKYVVAESGSIVSEGAIVIMKKEAEKEISRLIVQEQNRNQTGGDYSRRTEVVDEITGIVELYKTKGVILKGYSVSNITRKINGDICQVDKSANIVVRSTRKDKFEFKNKVLSNPEQLKKLVNLAFGYYSKDANKSIRKTAIKVMMFSRENENYYELATIPRSTIIRCLTKIAQQNAWSKYHDLKNNYHELESRKIYNQGAFTNMKFMEWLAIDDHVMEVSGVYKWNSVKKDWELRKVYMWSIIEIKTQMIVAYKIKADSFSANDVKEVLLQALMNIGKPINGILMDNGLAHAKECQEMLNRLKIEFDSGFAYEPTHKAPKERTYGYWKTELMSNFKNYIGGGRSEVRHSTKRLSPEQAELKFDEFINLCDKYVEGFYQTKPRLRETENGKIDISIRDWFNELYQQYEVQHLNPVDLRNAFMGNIVKKLHYNYINFRDNIYMVDDVLHPALDDRKYLMQYNPLDLQCVDIYALEDIKLSEEKVIRKGELVATLRGQKYMGDQERQDQVSKIRKNYKKAIRNMTEASVDMAIVNSVDPFCDELNRAGQLIETRKELVKATKNLIELDANKYIRLDVDNMLGKEDETEEPEEVKFELLNNDDVDELNNINFNYDELE
ncbi:MAG TPA: hypothetical protein PK559_07455 [Ignavibacteriaceae bacterium]|nr:hypothetical protein [Ignavibacteriaceae bacterium]